MEIGIDTEQIKDIASEQQTISINEYDELKNKYVYLLADFDNFRKRSVKEKAEVVKMANKHFALSLLDIVDDFGRMLEFSRDNQTPLSSAIEMTYSKLLNVLSIFNCKPIECDVDDEFDFNKHEAISVIPSNNGHKTGTIAKILATGWTMHDIVIRPTEVVTYQ